MNSMTINSAREVCTVEACIHDFHEVDLSDPEDRAFHEASPIVVVGSLLERVDVRVTRFDNERHWSVDAEVKKVMTVEEALADALRLQAGVAAKLTEGVDA